MSSQWAYIAEDASGVVRKGQVSASNELDALKQLSQISLSPIKLEPARNDISKVQLFRENTSLPLRHFSEILQGLSDLLGSGVSLAESLTILRSRTKLLKSAAFLDRLIKRIRAGSSLSDAMEEDTSQPPRLALALIQAGEKTGTLPEQIQRLSTTLAASLKLRRELIGQLAYPFALLILLALTILFLSFFVLPQFEGIFETASAAPPIETQMVLATGQFIRDYWLFAPLFILSGILFMRLFKERLSASFGTKFLKLPFIGNVILKIEAGRYTRSLGGMLEGGTPLASALPIAREAVYSSLIRNHLEEAERQVRAGTALAPVLSQTRYLPEEVISFVEIGERTGRLGPMMLKAADLCDQDTARSLKRLTAISGPALTAIMGLLTALVIASVMSGVLSLNEAVY